MNLSRPIVAAVLTVSDRCAAGTAVDASGPALERVLTERLGATISQRRVIPDEIGSIEETFWEWSRETAGIDLVVSTGGTGFSPRDVTPEAAARVIERPAPNLMELARLRCGQKANLAWLSRGVAGVAQRTLIITTPGSPKGAVETFEAVSDLIEHIIRLLRGEQPHQA